MEAIDIFNDVLTTERKHSQEGVSHKVTQEFDNTLNFSKMNFFINPTYTVAEDSKPYTVSSRYMHRKKQRSSKNSYAMELTQLLALAEIRYLDNANKLKEAIVANKKLHNLRVVHLIKQVQPIVQRLQILIAKTYWQKWICIHRESNPNRPITEAFRLWSFMIMWKKVNKRNKLRAFILFKERGIVHEFGIQYFGIESISRKKLSKFVPPFKKEPSNQNRLKNIIKPEGSLKSFKEARGNRSYFN